MNYLNFDRMGLSSFGDSPISSANVSDTHDGAVEDFGVILNVFIGLESQ